MEFLKAFFGDKAITYDELVQAINAYNGDEKNKEKLIKIRLTMYVVLVLSKTEFRLKN